LDHFSCTVSALFVCSFASRLLIANGVKVPRAILIVKLYWREPMVIMAHFSASTQNKQNITSRANLDHFSYTVSAL
jgi:hypothetical protein